MVLTNLILALGVFVIYQIFLFTNELFPRLYTLLQNWRHTRFHVIKFKSLGLVTPDQITDFLLSLLRYLEAGLTIFLTVVGFTYVLSFFPGTQQLASGIIVSIYRVFHGFVMIVVKFVPNLIR